MGAFTDNLLIRFVRKYWLTILFIILAFVPDPTDLIDGGTPILEIVVVVIDQLRLMKK